MSRAGSRPLATPDRHQRRVPPIARGVGAVTTTKALGALGESRSRVIERVASFSP